MRLIKLAKLISIALLSLVLFANPTDAAKGKQDSIAHTGDKVSVHYRGTFTDGTEFDSSKGKDPLSFTVGAGQMIPGFDNAVMGMKNGEKKTVTIPAKDAYGEHSEAYVRDVKRSQLPSNVKLEVGKEIFAVGEQGQPIPFTIIEVTADYVKVDGNHKMAGKDLTFEIELVKIG